MIRMTAIILATATTATASHIPATVGVTLDAGDSGVIYVDGLGFRPVDGKDTYGGGKVDCPFKTVWKDGRGDFVDGERECAGRDMMAGFMPEFEAVPAYQWDVIVPPARFVPVVVPAGVYPPTRYQPTPDAPTPVPLPATVWLMLVALGLLWGKHFCNRRNVHAVLNVHK